jgi:hypothetical protein
MSAVELKGVVKEDEQVYLDLGSVDLVDGTPVIDIKPYIPYSDSIPDARGGYAEQAPSKLEVNFLPAAYETLDKHPNRTQIVNVITEVLAQDPRQAYKKKQAGQQRIRSKFVRFECKIFGQQQLSACSGN